MLYKNHYLEYKKNIKNIVKNAVYKKRILMKRETKMIKMY